MSPWRIVWFSIFGMFMFFYFTSDSFHTKSVKLWNWNYQKYKNKHKNVLQWTWMIFDLIKNIPLKWCVKNSFFVFYYYIKELVSLLIIIPWFCSTDRQWILNCFYILVIFLIFQIFFFTLLLCKGKIFFSKIFLKVTV